MLALTSIVTHDDFDSRQAKSLTDVMRHLSGVGIGQNGELEQKLAVNSRQQLQP